jgi:hypothetical protein
MLSLSSRRSLIDRDHKTLSISAQCQILGLSRSSFYYLHCTESADAYSGQTLPVIPAQTRPLFLDEELG